MCPKISVCLPTYNYGRFIAQAIESILCQSFRDFEFLIIDDCSKDTTDEIICNYVERDSRIRYVRNVTNLGMVENWNFCLRMAKGEYIKFIFGDDFLVSEYALEKMLNILESDKSISLVGSSRMIVNDMSLKTDVWKSFNKNVIINGCDIIQSCLSTQKNLIGEPSAVMFRADQSKRGFDIRYKQLVDLEMWFHLLEQGRYAFLLEALCAFRVHNKQQTVVNGKEINARDVVRLYREYLGKKYIKFSYFKKNYLLYDSIYPIWKLSYKTLELDKGTARDYIKKYGSLKFYLFFPLYKILKPLRNLKGHMRSHLKIDEIRNCY